MHASYTNKPQSVLGLSPVTQTMRGTVCACVLYQQTSVCVGLESCNPDHERCNLCTCLAPINLPVLCCSDQRHPLIQEYIYFVTACMFFVVVFSVVGSCFKCILQNVFRCLFRSVWDTSNTGRSFVQSKQHHSFISITA